MQLSVIVPLFNCLALTRALTASLPGTLPPGMEWEAILVDDGSTDGTRGWLAGLGPPFRVLLNERNLGYGAANNRGAARARGDFLALLNNDLVLAPGWLEPMLRAHRRLGDRAGIVGNVQFDARTGAVDHAGITVDHRGKPAHDRKRPGRLARLMAPVRAAPLVTGACVLLRRKLWLELGGFDEGYFNGGEDIDLCLRARALGRINAVALRSTVRHHVSSSPGRRDRDEINSYRLARRWREAFRQLGQAAWSRWYFETYLPDPRDYPDPAFAWQNFLYLEGLRRTPPAAAVAGFEASIGEEFAHWRAMFGKGEA